MGKTVWPRLRAQPCISQLCNLVSEGMTVVTAAVTRAHSLCPVPTMSWSCPQQDCIESSGIPAALGAGSSPCRLQAGAWAQSC